MTGIVEGVGELLISDLSELGSAVCCNVMAHTGFKSYFVRKQYSDLWSFTVFILFILALHTDEKDMVWKWLRLESVGAVDFMFDRKSIEMIKNWDSIQNILIEKTDVSGFFFFFKKRNFKMELLINFRKFGRHDRDTTVVRSVILGVERVLSNNL